jgi:hypothetical protein
MLNYSTFDLSDNGTVLRGDIYSLDNLLTGESHHVGAINTDYNLLVYDKGVTNLSLTNSSNLMNKAYNYFGISTDYNSISSAHSISEYIKSNNINATNFKGALEQSFSHNISASNYFLSLASGFLLPLAYSSYRGMKKSFNEKENAKFFKNLFNFSYSATGSAIFFNNLKNYYTLARSSDLVSSASGLKGLYYNLGLFSLSNALYNFYCGIRDIKQHNKNLRRGLGNVGLKLKGYSELATGGFNLAGGYYLMKSASLDWIALNSSTLSMQGAIMGSMLGGIGLGLFALGIAVKLCTYYYIKHKKFSRTGNFEQTVYTIIVRDFNKKSHRNIFKRN